MSVQLLKEFRSSEVFEELVSAKMSFGTELMKDIGNVYCAALPAWMAAGLEEVAKGGREISGRNILAVGYGSGDAAESIPMTLVDGWEAAAALIGFEDALEPQQTLTKTQYENLHDSGTSEGLKDPEDGFVIDSVGANTNATVSDEGIEYYRFVR